MTGRYTVACGALFRWSPKRGDVRISKPNNWHLDEVGRRTGTQRQAREWARSLRKQNPKWWAFKVVRNPWK